MLDELKRRGVHIADVTLHVGPGTFRPVKAEYVDEHDMHAEYYHIPEAAAVAVQEAKREGRRVIAVGTTTARALESWARDGRRPRAGRTCSSIRATAGSVVDGLLTNFHLPRSSLLMLVSALLGRERTLAAYREAVKERYRFFSFGDAMLIL